jgi:serine/threonine-protein kinase
MAISNAVMKALEKDPAQRFATAEEFLQAIQGMVPAQEMILPYYPSPPKTIAVAPRPTTASVQPKAPSASGIQSLPLEEVSRKLAVYIGPVAKFVVKKLAAQSENLDYIYREAAKQISSDTDRAAFLRSRNK